ncbi:hypothetical protein SAXI111661_17755 [Saccharomonospora xinjiangensis]|nr:hypothetical protein EYD13_09965 [Saccharomonospora xinjiangensis]
MEPSRGLPGDVGAVHRIVGDGIPGLEVERGAPAADVVGHLLMNEQGVAAVSGWVTFAGPSAA